jgi:hypothetical protein
VQNDGSLTASEMNPPAVGVYPHIEVYETAVNNSGAQGLNEVYNNWETNKNSPTYPDNSRVLTWDSRTGTVRFSAGSLDAPSGQTQQVQVQSVMTPAMNGWEFDPLALAIQQNKLTVPNSLRKYLRIVPGSETVSVTYVSPNILGESMGAGVTQTEVFRRSSSSQVMDTAPQPADWNFSQYGNYPTALPEPGSYFFDTTNGKIILGFPWPGPNNPQRPQPVPHTMGGEPPSITIRFSYQTNLPTDVVRVDYATRSLLRVSLGMRAFDPSTGRLILTQLTDKIALRNMGR